MKKLEKSKEAGYKYTLEQQNLHNELEKLEEQIKDVETQLQTSLDYQQFISDMAEEFIFSKQRQIETYKEQKKKQKEAKRAGKEKQSTGWFITEEAVGNAD